MKVAVLTTVFPRWEGDFFGNYIYHHAEAHTDAGVDVRVVAPHAPGARIREDMGGVRVDRFRYALPASAQKIAYGGGVLTQLDRSLMAKLLFPVFLVSFFFKSMGAVRWADIVHAHWTLAGVIGLSLARLFRKRSVLTVYGIEVFTGRFRYFTKLCLRWADHVVCISSATQQQMEEQVAGDGPVASSVIPFGVPEEFLVQGEHTFNVRGHHGLPEDSIVVLTVGRLIERKGVEYLIRATPRLEDPKTHVIVAGGGADLGRLQGLAHELGVSERITFTDFVPGGSLPAYYAQCDVFAHPVVTDSTGDVEGLGIVILEAMAAGKPSVASGIGGIADVVVDGETGYLIPEKNEDAIVQRVSALVADRDLRRRMGVAARNRVEERFLAADRAADVMRVFEGLMEKAAS